MAEDCEEHCCTEYSTRNDDCERVTSENQNSVNATTVVENSDNDIMEQTLPDPEEHCFEYSTRSEDNRLEKQSRTLPVFENSNNNVKEDTFPKDEEQCLEHRAARNEDEKIHVKRRSLVCKECRQSFTRKDNLKRHMKIHTNERPSPCLCEKCGHSFTTSWSLKIHMRIHTKERPSSCLLTTFTMSDYLINYS
ncbi:uncharacterized protein LOC144444322 [Glandiceps talaboti]